MPETLEKRFLKTSLNRFLEENMPQSNFFEITDWKNHHPKILIPEFLMMPDLDSLKKILEEKSIFNNLNRIKDDHFLFYLPSDLNLQKLESIYPDRFRTYTNNGKRCWYSEKKFVRDSGLGEWCLGFINPIPRSQGRDYEESRRLIPIGYDVPTNLQATAMHLLYFSKNKEYLNLACLGRTSSFDGQDRITVGRFNRSGLLIGRARDEDEELDTGLFVFKKIKQSLSRQKYQV